MTCKSVGIPIRSDGRGAGEGPARPTAFWFPRLSDCTRSRSTGVTYYYCKFIVSTDGTAKKHARRHPILLRNTQNLND